ncbi:MAG: hypothetical protein AB7N54_02820 [Alphaproteobacteria bacterium]
MRVFLIVVFVVATAAFVLTDPRWSGGLTQPIAASWQGMTAVPASAEGPLTTRFGPEERCAQIGQWLEHRQTSGEPVDRSEMAAVERVMASCQR